jgi:hypothetical protein
LIIFWGDTVATQLAVGLTNQYIINKIYLLFQHATEHHGSYSTAIANALGYNQTFDVFEFWITNLIGNDGAVAIAESLKCN